MAFDSKIYIGTTRGVFTAVDARTGKIVWAFAAGRPIFGSADHFVYAVDRMTGKELWKHDTGRGGRGPTARAGDRVFIGNRGGGLYALKLVG